MIEAKQTHCGQYKPYGDFFRIWNVQTNPCVGGPFLEHIAPHIEQ